MAVELVGSLRLLDDSVISRLYLRTGNSSDAFVLARGELGRYLMLTILWCVSRLPRVLFTCR